MKYLYAYLGTLYYALGCLGIVFLIGNSFVSLDAIPMYLIYLSLFVGIAGPIKLFIQSKN